MSAVELGAADQAVFKRVAERKQREQREQQRTTHNFEVTFELDTKGKVKEIILPPEPDHDDATGLRKWLTCVFRLDSCHPITGGKRQGVSGPDGHIELYRAGAPSIEFRPASRAGDPRQLTNVLNTYLLPTDAKPHKFNAGNCASIAYVLRMLCGQTATLSAAEQMLGIVGEYISDGEEIEGTTRVKTAVQRYHVAVALRRPADCHPSDPGRYLYDPETGEVAIRVTDLATAARRQLGSMPYGDVDARMDAAGWARVRLEGHAEPGRAGRKSPHAGIDVYRGKLPEHVEAVTT